MSVIIVTIIIVLIVSHQLGHHANDVPVLPPLLGAQLGICGAVMRQHLPGHSVHHLHLHPGDPAARRSCEYWQRTCCCCGSPGKLCRYCRSHSGGGVELGGRGRHLGVICRTRRQTLLHQVLLCRTASPPVVVDVPDDWNVVLFSSVYLHITFNFTHSVGRFVCPQFFLLYCVYLCIML